MHRVYPLVMGLAGLLSGCSLYLFDSPMASNHNAPVRRVVSKDYFPFVQGAEWTYESLVSPLGEKRTRTISISSVEKRDGQEIAKARTTITSSIPSITPYFAEVTYIKNALGIFSHDSTGSTYQIVYFPLEAGTRSVDTASTSISITHTGAWRNVMSNTNVSIYVASSEWSSNCYGVEETYTIDNIGIYPANPGTVSFKISKTTILGEGIGPLRIIQNSEGNQSVEVLATYSIPVR